MVSRGKRLKLICTGNDCKALLLGNFNNIIYDWAAPEAVPLHAAGGGLDEVGTGDVQHRANNAVSTMLPGTDQPHGRAWYILLAASSNAFCILVY